MATEVKLRGKRTNSHAGWKKMLQLERRKEAEERQAIRNKYTPTEQLVRLDIRLGVNVGAVQERTRLNAMIQSQILQA